MADPLQPRSDDRAVDASTAIASDTPEGSPAEACTGSADGGTVRWRFDAGARGRGGRSPGSMRGLVREVEQVEDTGGAPSRVARRAPRAPRLPSSALTARPALAVRPGSRTRPGPAPCRAARVLRRRGRLGRSDRRLERILRLELGPASWRSASATSPSPPVPVIRAPGTGAVRPYARPSPPSPWARPASLRAPGVPPVGRGRRPRGALGGASCGSRPSRPPGGPRRGRVPRPEGGQEFPNRFGVRERQPGVWKVGEGSRGG